MTGHYTLYKENKTSRFRDVLSCYLIREQGPFIWAARQMLFLEPAVLIPVVRVPNIDPGRLALREGEILREIIGNRAE